MPLSGPQWVEQFLESTNTDDLVEPFRGNVKRLLDALKRAGATVRIACTLRPPERAYLMHYSFAIARQKADPSSVPALTGVDIQWNHPGGDGSADVEAARKAAEQMVEKYGIVFPPVLKSRHTEGSAIDMDISWQGDLTIVDANNKSVKITKGRAPELGMFICRQSLRVMVFANWRVTLRTGLSTDTSVSSPSIRTAARYLASRLIPCEILSRLGCLSPPVARRPALQ